MGNSKFQNNCYFQKIIYGKRNLRKQAREPTSVSFFHLLFLVHPIPLDNGVRVF